MELSEALLTTLVAGGISIIVALITYNSTLRKVKSENMILEKQIQTKFLEKLYELRLKNYPKAFELTDILGKKKGIYIESLEIASRYKEIEKELRAWKSGESGLILSERSLEAYYELMNSFKAQFALGDKYNDEQLQRFYKARTNFRNELRKDIGLMFKSDN